ncbi:hypothetical protein Gogos_018082, partial [Gossypium gossypioides]|nr:hypothetical protein [Gossypium gossypioides]
VGFFFFSHDKVIDLFIHFGLLADCCSQGWHVMRGLCRSREESFRKNGRSVSYIELCLRYKHILTPLLRLSTYRDLDVAPASVISGVESYEVDLKEQKVTVKGQVQPDAVLQTVSKTGKKTTIWDA